MNFKINEIEINGEEDSTLNSHFFPADVKNVEIGEEKFVLPIYFVDNWDKIDRFQVRNDDVYVTGHPKTGTTWLNEILHFIMKKSSADDGITDLLRKQSFLDYELLFPTEKLSQIIPNYKEKINCDTLESPRIIKTHLPWFLLPEQIRLGVKSPKIIHMLRAPKDTCLSYYHFLHGNTGNFDHFSTLFLKGKLQFGPYHVTVKSYWEERDNRNIFFVKFSELKKNPHETIRKIAAFLGKLINDDEVAEIVKRTSFDYMKNNIGVKVDRKHKIITAAVGQDVERVSFMRKGIEGGHRSVMTNDLIEEFDKVSKREFEGVGITF